MKRIIITESQAKAIKKYLNEATDPAEEYAKEVEAEFISSLSSIKVGQKLALIFGKEGDDGAWVESELTIVTFIVSEINEDELILKHIISKGKQTTLNRLGDKQRYILPIKGGFIFNGGNPYIKIGLEVNGKRDFANIQNFLQFEIVDSDLDVDSILDSTHAKWEAIRKELMSKSEYEPSWFGMDNFFFYPKGFRVMDKIASKYGADIKDTQSIKFTITGPTIGVVGKKDSKAIGRLLQGGKYIGSYDSDNNKIDIEESNTTFEIKFQEGDKVAPGAEYFVLIDIIVGGKVLTKQESRIKVTKIE